MLSTSLTHHTVAVNGTTLHYVSAGTHGTPILLVHGFPETSRTFHRLLPLLAVNHRVFAVDLRGFGDSSHDEGEYGSTVTAEDLHALIAHLGLGPVHITTQDISGATVFRLAAQHPDDLISFIGIETGLAGFGFEKLAGVWYIPMLATPGIPDLLLRGKERDLVDWVFRRLTGAPGSVSEEDLAEFARAFAVPGGWRGASGLYASALSEGEELTRLAASSPIRVPTLAVGSSGGSFTADTLDRVSELPVSRVVLEGVGHYVALEAPEPLAGVLLEFIGRVESEASSTR